MGAIVAGMYASGMSPEEIEEQFKTLDWWNVLKDHSPYPFLVYRRKQDDKRFMGVEFGLKGYKFVFPPGMAYGQKLNNVLETFCINSVGITDFDQLNIPYRAIATDLRSGKAIALKSGNLATAMRASMAVPGMFTPVRLDEMVLVDGGILNNIPVDVVKQMGADIIIAVDVGATAAAMTDNSDYRSLGAVASRTYSLMQRPDQEKQLEQADVVIAPELHKLSAAQFHKVDKIIPQGRIAAEAIKDKLTVYSVDAATFQAYLANQRKKHTDKIQIKTVKISGNERVSNELIKNHIKTQAGLLSMKSMHDDVNRIHGMGDFQTVTYNLEPVDEGFDLDYKLAEKFWGPAYLRFGMKVEITTSATALWSLLLNYTRAQLNSLGGEARIDMEGGGHLRYVRTEWYQPISSSGRFFVAPSLLYSGEDIDIYDESQYIADIEQHLAYGEFDTGMSFFEYGEIRLGVQGGHAKADGNSGMIPLNGVSDSVVGITTSLRLDQLNDPVFASKGYQLNLDALFAYEEIGSSKTFSRLELTAQVPFTMGSHTITPKLSMGTSFGTELPFYALFDVGGLNSFAGLAPYQLRGNYYSVGSLGYRYELGKLPPTFGNGLYVLSRFDIGNAWFDANEARFENVKYGMLVGLGADTIAGTCILGIGKAESTNLRFYFSIGTNF
jgi:NTE family protein